MKINMLGLLDTKGQENTRRVYGVDGIAPTLTTSQGGNRQPKILVGGDDELIIDQSQYRREKEYRIYPDVSMTLQARDYKEPRLTLGGEGMKTLKTNDLFCGAGGMGLGFKQAGFDIAGAWDFDKYAVQSYTHNVGEHVKQADISEMKYEDLPQANVWTFGFPCQDLSVAGKQAGLFEGKRSGLFFEVMRLLDETTENDINRLPDIIMAENVKGLKPYLEVLEEEYKKRGYKMYYTLYNSKFWGVPQNRERYFVVGVHESIEKEFIFPEQQEYFVPRLSTVLENEVDEKYYISEEKAAKVIAEAKQKIDLESIHACLTPDRPKRQNGPRAKAEDLESHTLTAQDRHGVIVKGDIMTRNNPQRQHGFSSETSFTLRTAVTHGYIDESLRVRKLTPREYLRLQGFPEDFEIVVSDTQIYKQAGNAVTVNVARAIAERIRVFLLSL
jgi:DNA (cytosine-5)-methyltransferase 1